MPQLAVNVSTTTPVMQQGGRLQSGTARAPEHHNAHPGRVLPLGSRRLVLPQAQHVVHYAAAGVIPD